MVPGVAYARDLCSAVPLCLVTSRRVTEVVGTWQMALVPAQGHGFQLSDIMASTATVTGTAGSPRLRIGAVFHSGWMVVVRRQVLRRGRRLQCAGIRCGWAER